MDPNVKLSVTIREGWVQAHQPGTRWEAADGMVYVVDSVQEASVVDVDDPRISAPVWVVSSHPAEDRRPQRHTRDGQRGWTVTSPTSARPAPAGRSRTLAASED
jgi:hypothetical protein